MGGFLSKTVTDMLSKFTFNFEQEQFNLNIFWGKARVDNLFLNTQKINQILSDNKVPLKLQFGLLKWFDINLSFMSQRIESILIDQLILIFGDGSSTRDIRRPQREGLFKEID